MDISKPIAHWPNSTKYWMSVGFSYDNEGKLKIEIVKPQMYMTSYGMPDYDEQFAFAVKIEKVQNKICKCLESIEQELQNEQ